MPRHATTSSRDLVSIVCRVLLGGLFIFAGVMKLQDAQQFAFAIKAFKVFPGNASGSLIPFLSYAAPWIEIVAGAALVVGLWARASALLIACMLAAFIAAVVSVIARGIETKCTCFGKFEWPCTGSVGYCQVVRNLALMALAVPVLWLGPGRFALDRESQDD